MRKVKVIMCGIAGCLKFKGKIEHDKFDKMVDIIAYRGPDDRGTFYENNLALGHRRLSIIDLSIDGHQPFLFEDRYVIVFNGEIYNYLELQEELKQAGYCFRTKTDTEVLIAAYAYWGQKCVDHFNGMWAFAIYDREQQSVFCSRDRFGVKPFYYTEQEGMFLFASEIKQFFEMLEQQPRANRNTLLQFLIRGNMDYSAETMFQEIYQLPGGYNLLYDIRKQTYEIKQYFDVMQVTEKEESYKEACKSFRDGFYEAVKLRLRADVPVGYCLSGGLDSSAIVCMANRIIGTRECQTEQHTISSCFEDKRYDEQEYIDEVVKHTSVKSHRVFPQEMNLFDEVDKIIWHMDEPFTSTSIYAGWNVFKEAHDCNLKVMLDGQGADEQLAGYTQFYIVMVAECLRKGQFKKFFEEWKVYKKSRAVTEQHISSKAILLQAIVSLMIPAKLMYFFKKIYYCLPQNRKKLPFSNRLLSHALKNEVQLSIGNARKYIEELMHTSMVSLLHYEDRNSMAYSIESRVPFLDYNLVETIYGMPFDYKLRKGITKSVLRDGLRGILPEKIRKRYSKLGFVTPEDQWINHNYAKYRAELQQSANLLSKVVDPDMIMKWFDANEGKLRRGDYVPWRVICAGHWVKLFQVKL